MSLNKQLLKNETYKIVSPLRRGGRCTNHDVQTAGKTGKTFETLRISSSLIKFAH